MFPQLPPLIRKTLLITLLRRPLPFLLSIYLLPLLLLALLASIPRFLSSSNVYGVATPTPIRSLASSLSASRGKLVVVRPPYLGPDALRVIDTFTRGIDEEKLLFLEDEAHLTFVCLANLRGVSDCHAAVTMVDSPLTNASIPNSQSEKHVWQYTIRADPARDDSHFNVRSPTRRSDQEGLFLPLHLAVDAAITNSSTIPDVVAFTAETQDQQEKATREHAVLLIGQTYVFALLASHLFLVYRFVSLVTHEREAGVSQLVDAMGGGGSVVVARVLAWLIVLDVLCLPLFIGFGVLYAKLLFPTSSLGLVVGWQILLGLAINGASVFASAFFSKSRVSAVYVVGMFLLLAVAAQLYSFQRPPHKPNRLGVLLLSLLFPSSNHVFFAQQMCLWELNGTRADTGRVPPPYMGINSTSYRVTQATLLGFLGIHIVVYPIGAVLVERLMHGIDYSRRTFARNAASSSSSGVVAATLDLGKTFSPNLFERLFCCGKRRPVKAVDGVSIEAHRGQMLCLVGANGSGKTTTLRMMAGLVSPTSGSVRLDALPSRVGVCPQRNTLWDDLTVWEHVSLWSAVKGGGETHSELEDLIRSCDLSSKRNSRSCTLSGGQKRKLQLACMFVGDSSVCLIDECTSGLDPLSRRVIWDMLLRQRARRTILFTTHFLDEVDVLADRIVVLSGGKVKCQGAAAELKNRFGGGHKVLAPLSASRLDVEEHPLSVHQDRLVYHTPDSRSAAALCKSLQERGVSDVSISGPSVEDVFLRVADSSSPQSPSLPKPTTPDFTMTPGRTTSFSSQVRVLLRKRFTILRRFWWPYLYVLALPLAITPNFKPLLKEYQQPSCLPIQPELYAPAAPVLYWDEGCVEYGCDRVAIAPEGANKTMFGLVEEGFFEFSDVNATLYDGFPVVLDSRRAFLEYIAKNASLGPGGVYMGSGHESPVLAYRLDSWGASPGATMMNLWSQMESGVEIISSQEGFAESRRSANNIGVIYVVFFTLLQAIYPAAFVLYPSMEKSHKVRALEYANGVRRGPLWVAYGLFDSLFVLALAVGVTAIISTQLEWNGPIWVMLPILALYGFAAILLGYVVAHFVDGPLKAFLAVVGVSIFMYAVAAISFAVGSGYSDAAQMDKLTLGIFFGVYLVLPIGNVFRAMLIGLNVLEVGCKDGSPTPPASIYAFGGPILYLCLQVAVLLVVIVWIEGDMALFRRSRPTKPVDTEKTPSSPSPEVQAETARAEATETDLLRALHVTKTFGSNTAVDDVTFGLPASDVLALIGPNGAGKSTLVNMLQAELSADSGTLLLGGRPASSRAAQQQLGVCPQYDALDLMSTREHLAFYARVKGISDVAANVSHVMARLDLVPHADTLATKLSGGNKRKLSLAIALMGTPPVLVLDEPTSAMDAVAKRAFWALVRDISPGRSLLLTTHSMEEADALATRTAILARRLLAVGTTQALRARYSNRHYVNLLLASAPTSEPEEMDRVRQWLLAELPDAQLERDMLGGQLHLTVPGTSPVTDLIDLFERGKEEMGIEYYSVGGATLETVFLSVVRENNVQEEDGSTGHRRFWRRFLNQSTA